MPNSWDAMRDRGGQVKTSGVKKRMLHDQEGLCEYMDF